VGFNVKIREGKWTRRIILKVVKCASHVYLTQHQKKKMKTKLNKTEKQKMRTWVELDRSAIKKNYDLFRRIIKKPTKFMAVVKSNAYGHGLIEYAKEMARLGVDWIGVDSFEEGLEIRRVGIKKPIMVFGYVAPEYFKEAVKNNISVTISSMDSLKALAKQKAKLKIHIKPDTGLHRQGFLMEEMNKVLKILKKNPQISVVGLYSHFAIGEDPKYKKHSAGQVKEFLIWCEAFEGAGYKPLRHICATSSTMMYPEFHFDMVRVGIGIYGLWPSKETKQAVGRKYKLWPVLSWKAVISEVKTLPKGEKLGYDLTETLKRKSKVAVVPVGYWHGYPRLLSRRGALDVAGKQARVMGNISMDMLVIDVTEVKNVKSGDEVVIIGGKNNHWAEADIMAQDSDTINYEIVTRINPIIKRFYRLNPELPRFVVKER